MVGRSCTYLHPDGRRCRATPLRDAPFCFWHSPEREEDAAEARRLGGLRRRRGRTVSGAYDFAGLGTVESIRRIVGELDRPLQGAHQRRARRGQAARGRGGPRPGVGQRARWRPPRGVGPVTTARLVAAIEASLSPRTAVLAWLTEAQSYEGLSAYARSLLDVPLEAAPLTKLERQVTEAVRRRCAARLARESATPSGARSAMSSSSTSSSSRST
jgi:hypothetical protein